MAEVFVACEHGDHDFQRLVVIKRILPHLGADQKFLDMFLQEARIAAQINHPNVVQIYHLGDEGGLPYIAMEYVDGITFKDLMRAAQDSGRVVPPGVAIGLAIQSCAGAHAAHELTDATGTRLEIVHRDLSPHNLMITAEGHVKVLDFGIAKATEGMDHTRTGVLKGKINYLSPEQCKQEPLDRRSDLFTLAGVIWEMLAFDRPFQGKSELNTMQNIVTGKRQDLRDLRPDIPEPILHILEKALSSEPAQRQANADTMRRSLIAAANELEFQYDLDTIGAFVREHVGGQLDAFREEVDDARSSVHSAPHFANSLTGQQSRVGLLTLSGWLTAAVGLGVAGVALVVLAGLLITQPQVLQGPDEAAVLPMMELPTYEGTPLVFQLAPTIDPELLLADLEPIRRYIAHSLKRPVEMSVASSYEAAAKSLADGDAEFGILPPFIYIKTHKNHPDVRPILTKVWEGSTGSDSVLLVRAESPISNVSQLKGKQICYSDPNSTTGYVLPRAHLRQQGVDPDVDLTPHVSGNHLQVVRDIIENTCDVGGIYTGAYLAAKDAGVDVAATRVLGVAGRSPHDAICAGPAAKAETIETLVNALTSFDPEIHTGQTRIGKVERLTGFTIANDQTYDPLREAIRLAERPQP